MEKIKRLDLKNSHEDEAATRSNESKQKFRTKISVLSLKKAEHFQLRKVP
jgi:hypothetical protein